MNKIISNELFYVKSKKYKPKYHFTQKLFLITFFYKYIRNFDLSYWWYSSRDVDVDVDVGVTYDFSTVNGDDTHVNIRQDPLSPTSSY